MSDQNYSEKKYSILIADDNQNNLRVLSSMLERLGYKVRVATSGELAIKSVKLIKPDLILLDIHMPDIDGYEACRILKSSVEYSDIPVIFLSALSEVFNKIKAFEAGGVDYITKPFELEEVRIRIENHIKLEENTRMLREALDDLRNKESLLVQNEKMVALGTLTSGIAHEINNPVNFISNSISALEERVSAIYSENRLPDSEMIEDFNTIFMNISTGLEQVTGIVHSLRSYSRVDTDNMLDTDINEVVNSALTILHYRLGQRISVDRQFPPFALVKCQPGRLSQVFINVISNSIDAIEEALEAGIIQNDSGKIIINIDNVETRLVIKITDNGVGIDSSVLNRVFDPFFTTKPVGRGTGLGLSICQSIIRNHGGSISIESSVKNGTSVIISLPISGV